MGGERFGDHTSAELATWVSLVGGAIAPLTKQQIINKKNECIASNRS
ncbi:MULTISPECIES: hypothetical protein [Brasilonema]|jgi:hypothetical protein|nr:MULTISPECIES: hypothetical protein [Brasilonema]